MTKGRQDSSGGSNFVSGFGAEDVQQAWEEALAMWGKYVVLSPPEPYGESSDDDQWPGDDPLAFIDLETRQVVVNYELLHAMDAADSLSAVLAHEIGHHVAYPRTLGELATLQTLERQLLPGFTGSLVNLFLDLQVNEFVGRSDAEALVAVYRGFRARHTPPINPIFAFYLGIYESLWGLDQSTLVDMETANVMEEMFPAWRADARMFGHTFYGLVDTYLQFVYFCSVFLRYITSPSTGDDFARPSVPLGDDVPQPSPADYAGAIRAIEQGRGESALEEAQHRGWIEDGEVLDEMDAFEIIDGLVQGGHGRGVAKFREMLAERHYAHLVDRHLVELPATEVPSSDPRIPETLVSWEPGDDPRAIDWVASVMERGPLAAAMPRRRVLARDDEGESETGATALEIYLDTSGSMPVPTEEFNAMTLAGQILSAAAIRSGGRVRAAIYSDGDPITSNWLYGESTARQFLLNYAGGGTRFPFGLLREWAEDEPRVIRVVISDRGFIYDLEREEGPGAVLEAADASELMIVILTDGTELLQKGWPAIFDHRNTRIMGVASLTDLASVARRLADALYRT